MPSVRLFVYGSLKRGGQHHDLLQGARFLGPAETARGFELVTLELAAERYSALVHVPGGSESVSGELFEVEEARLPALDAFEGEAYERRVIGLVFLAGNATSAALAYLKKSG